MKIHGWIAAALAAVLVIVGSAGAGALNGQTQITGTTTTTGIPTPCTSYLTKRYQTLTARRSPTVSLGGTAVWATVTNESTSNRVGVRLTAADTDPYVIPPGATSPAFYLSAGVANIYPDTSATSTTGGDYLSIFACF